MFRKFGVLCIGVLLILLFALGGCHGLMTLPMKILASEITDEQKQRMVEGIPKFLDTNSLHSEYRMDIRTSNAPTINLPTSRFQIRNNEDSIEFLLREYLPDRISRLEYSVDNVLFTYNYHENKVDQSKVDWSDNSYYSKANNKVEFIKNNIYKIVSESTILDTKGTKINAGLGALTYSVEVYYSVDIFNELNIIENNIKTLKLRAMCNKDGTDYGNISLVFETDEGYNYSVYFTGDINPNLDEDLKEMYNDALDGIRSSIID